MDLLLTPDREIETVCFGWLFLLSSLRWAWFGLVLGLGLGYRSRAVYSKYSICNPYVTQIRYRARKGDG
jgi:hypothetical protein